jgi:hypothetical protein
MREHRTRRSRFQRMGLLGGLLGLGEESTAGASCFRDFSPSWPRPPLPVINPAWWVLGRELRMRGRLLLLAQRMASPGASRSAQPVALVNIACIVGRQEGG